MSSECEECERLDPRIRDKLEELNEYTDNINRLEKQLDERNALFAQTLTESTIMLAKIGNKLGKCVDESRTYYEAKQLATHLQRKCQKAAVQYERSCHLHSQAKQMIAITEQRFRNRESLHNQFDNNWQEMLNNANDKFVEAETLKQKSESEHSRCMQMYLNEEKRISVMERQLKSAIKKSKPYFEESERVQQRLNQLKSSIEDLSKVILECKQNYSQTLKDLEMISEEIHEKRAQIIAHSLKREPGVGAELNCGPQFDESECHHEEVPQLQIDSQLCHTYSNSPLVANKLSD